MTELNSLGRLAEVLQAYGANAAHWPQTERAMLLALIAESRQASNMLDQARRLDLLLDQYMVPEADDKLLQKVLATIPAPNLFDQILNWLWPERKSRIWQPALAICLPLIFGILLGSFWTPLEPDYDWDEEGMYVMGMYTPEDSEP